MVEADKARESVLVNNASLVISLLLTLKFKGTMLNTRITNNMLDFSSSVAHNCMSVHTPWENHVPVPKLGPPLNARPDHRWPCITPALTSSKNRYRGSWNLSLTRAGFKATYIARARGEWL